MDTHAFASLAHIRILLIPVGNISPSSFEIYAAELRSFESIRLEDIPSDMKDERARFLPSPLSTGHLYLSFLEHPIPISHVALSLLRPSHFPLAVIGIASCSRPESLTTLNTQFAESLVGVSFFESIFPLAKKCFVFEEDSATTSLNLSNDLSDLVILPSMMGNKKLYIGTLLADICSQILGEFGVVAQALESPLGNEYLNSSVLPVLPPLAEIPSSLNAINYHELLHPLGSHNSQPEISRPNISNIPALKRNSSLGPNFRQQSLNVQAPKKRMSTIGSVSSHGRLYKVLGDLFLLAGRIEDASIWYMEALQLLKNSPDPIWHAGSLEGLATISILEAWSAGHGLHTSMATAKEPWTEVGDKLAQATTLYQKSPITEVGDINALLAYIYCCCILRHSMLLFSVWSAKGWGPLAFSTMLQPGPKPYLPPTLISNESGETLTLDRMSSISGVPRSMISATIGQIHGPWLLHLGSRERITTLEAMASIYSCLGYKRKEAYVLREVLGCIMDLMVCGREGDDAQASSSPATASLGIHSFSGDPGDNWGTVGVRLSERTDGNSSILKLLKYVCKVLGINLDAVQLVENGPNDANGNVVGVQSRPDVEECQEHQPMHGWPELQVGVVREAVAVAEALPDFLAVAQFALSSLKTLQPVLSAGDQYHLYATSTRALVTSQRRGNSKSIEYWAASSVMSIAIAPLPLIRLPIEKPISVFRSYPDVVPLLQGVTDPFLYNPRKAAVTKGKLLVVQSETVEFIVIFQNPFVFDLELESLSLSTSGVQFETTPIRVQIPSKSIYEVVLVGRALHPGNLVIRGCFVQTQGSARRECILPLFTNEEQERVAKQRARLLCESDRFKHPGLASYPWMKSFEERSQLDAGKGTNLGIKPFKFLECTVVPQQPLLRVRRTSINHGALMLYDGERATVRITLENISPIPINFLRLVFEDSTITRAQQLLSEGDLSVFDAYEKEYDIINRPLFSWDTEETPIIPPGENISLNLSCYGKVGCTDGTVHFSYSLLQDTEPSGSTVLFTRQLSYPVMVTVYQMLECQGMDILPFPSYSIGPDSVITKKHLNVDCESSWCLFSIDVRNTYGLPFEVIFERTDGLEDDSARIAATIPPGSMTRPVKLVIPLRKVILSEEELSRAIPALSERQFVVNKTDLFGQDLQTQRELFWYREALFNCVRGRWREVGGPRNGELCMRQQRMTLKMLECFRRDTAQIEISLQSLCDTTSEFILGQTGKFYPQLNKFACLHIQVLNLTSTSLVFTVNVNLEPLELILHEGLLSDIAVGRLDSGESREIIMTLCFLTLGRFDIGVQVKALRGTAAYGQIANGHITAIVEETSR